MWIIGGLSFWLSGCSKMPARVENFLSQAKNEWNAIASILQGGRNPLAKKSAIPVEGNASAQIVQEMIRVLLMREPGSKKEFATYVESLDQGISIEGLLNGMTHSAHYRNLEETGQASAKSLEGFCREMELLRSAQIKRSIFFASDALPLPRPVAIGPSDGTALPSPSALPWVCKDIFSKSSLFTLKRVLSSEVIRTIDEKQIDRAKLADWYSEWVVTLATRKVDFGLELRNRADRDFHRKWAMDVRMDLLKWESVNRLNRILNQTQEK